MKRKKILKYFVLYLFSMFTLGCNLKTDHTDEYIAINEEPPAKEVTLKVTATAYNSVEEQTKSGNVGLAAWGDILIPGERAIAVSRDLIKLGLTHNSKIKIHGLPGIYIVKDKMNKRWKNKIDIYMGLDEEAAFNWGKQQVQITFSKDVNPESGFY